MTKTEPGWIKETKAASMGGLLICAVLKAAPDTKPTFLMVASLAGSNNQSIVGLADSAGTQPTEDLKLGPEVRLEMERYANSCLV